MGNQEVKQSSRYRYKTLQQRDRNNYSVDITTHSRKSGKNAFNSFQNNLNTLEIVDQASPSKNRKKSFNFTNQKSNNELNIQTITQQRNNRQSIKRSQLIENMQQISPNHIISQKESSKILQQLSKRNQQLRRQLKQINLTLSQKLKRKKFIPKKKSPNQQQNSDQQDKQQQKQLEIKNAGLKRQLDNAYKQIDMYKRTLQQLKSKQDSQYNVAKLKTMENSIVQLDRIVNQTIKKIQALKNVRKNQQKGIQKDINQDLIDNVELLKNQQDQIKKKIKQINKKDTLRENHYKRQQAYLFQVQKKYRQLSGQYFPQIGKKKSVYIPGGKDSNKKVDLSTKQKQEVYPSNAQIQITINELAQLRNKHEQYHKKINFQLQQKNKQTQQLQKINKQVQLKQKLIQSLKQKLITIRKILRPNKKSLFGYDSYQGSQLQSQYGGVSQAQKQIQVQHHQDQFDIKHLIANIPKPVRVKPVQIERNVSVKSGNQRLLIENKGGMVVTGEKSQPKIWGTALNRKQQRGKNFKGELTFDDSVQFQSQDQQPLIIGLNIWVNKNGQIIAIQAIYLNKEQIRYGVKSSNAADGFLMRYDLQSPDYLKNITGGFNQSGIVQYIALYSKKGKSATFGNKRENQQIFNFGLSANERPFRLSGSSLMIDSEPKICKIGIQICPQ